MLFAGCIRVIALSCPKIQRDGRNGSGTCVALELPSRLKMSNFNAFSPSFLAASLIFRAPVVKRPIFQRDAQDGSSMEVARKSPFRPMMSFFDAFLNLFCTDGSPLPYTVQTEHYPVHSLFNRNIAPHSTQVSIPIFVNPVVSMSYPNITKTGV